MLPQPRTRRGDAALDRDLFEVTMGEVQKGWLRGPLRQRDLDDLGCWVASKRFPVLQGKKLRPLAKCVGRKHYGTNAAMNDCNRQRNWQGNAFDDLVN